MYRKTAQCSRVGDAPVSERCGLMSPDAAREVTSKEIDLDLQ
jgi:hypothetical protein